MTLTELKEWINTAKKVDQTYTEYDGCGNERWESFYEKDGELYRVYFMNGHETEKWGEKGYVRDEYEPEKVIRKTRTIEQTYYEIA